MTFGYIEPKYLNHIHIVQDKRYIRLCFEFFIYMVFFFDCLTSVSSTKIYKFYMGFFFFLNNILWRVSYLDCGVSIITYFIFFSWFVIHVHFLMLMNLYKLYGMVYGSITFIIVYSLILWLWLRLRLMILFYCYFYF